MKIKLFIPFLIVILGIFNFLYFLILPGIKSSCTDIEYCTIAKKENCEEISEDKYRCNLIDKNGNKIVRECRMKFSD